MRVAWAIIAALLSGCVFLLSHAGGLAVEVLKDKAPKVLQEVAPEAFGAKIVEHVTLSPSRLEWPGSHPAGPGKTAVSRTFNAKYAQTLIVTGTAYGASDQGPIGFEVRVNDRPVEQTHIDIDEAKHNHHLVPTLVAALPSSPDGQYKIDIVPLWNSWIDENDQFTITLLK